jgi:Lrp/AsnC family leucine-responsive transcriptional regulator
LAVDADVGFVDLGQRVGLSPPAVHDRVKKMRAAGYIRGKVALIDASAIGKPVLAFVLIDTDGWGRSEELMAFARLPEVEELHSVAGDTSVIGKVRCASTSDLEALLARLYAIKGVRGTRTYMTLSTYLERPAQVGITQFGGGDGEQA